jgi:hypothetical protein
MLTAVLPNYNHVIADQLRTIFVLHITRLAFGHSFRQTRYRPSALSDGGQTRTGYEAANQQC